MSTFGTFSVGNSGGFGNFGSGDGDAGEADSCEPRESTGTPAEEGGLRDLTTPGDTWYDPYTGKLYKDRVQGDGYDKKDPTKKTEPWPRPKSKFGDAEEARAEGIDLAPFPPSPAPPLFDGDKKTNAWFPGRIDPTSVAGYWGNLAMCSTFATVIRNIINEDLLGKRGTKPPEVWVGASIFQKTVDCIIDCSIALPRGGVPGVPPPPGMPKNMDLREGGSWAFPGWGTGQAWRAYTLRKCKEYCMAELWSEHVDEPPEKYRHPHWRSSGDERPSRPIPGEEDDWTDPGGSMGVPLVKFGCPPFDEGEIITLSNVKVGAVKWGASTSQPGRLWEAKPKYHTITVEIVGECGSEGITVRTIENRHQRRVAGASCVWDIDKRGHVTRTYGTNCGLRNIFDSTDLGYLTVRTGPGESGVRAGFIGYSRFDIMKVFR